MIQWPNDSMTQFCPLSDRSDGRVNCIVAATSLQRKLGVNSNDAPVAQMDRAAAFEAEGRGFESLQARQFLCAFGVANLQEHLRYLPSLRMTEHNGSQDCVRVQHADSRPERSRRGADHESKMATLLTMPRPRD